MPSSRLSRWQKRRLRGRRPLLWLTTVIALTPDLAPAVAQFDPTPPCATTPDATPYQRLVPPSCGTATFAVDANQHQQAELRLSLLHGNVYIRTLHLIYGATAGARPLQVDISLHRLFLEGDSTDAFAATVKGLGLQSVTIDITAAGYGSEPTTVALTGLRAVLPQQRWDATVTPSQPTATPTAAALDPSQWVLVGSTFAHLRNLHDTITIGRGKGRFDQLVLSSRGGATPVQSVQVVPINGAPFAVSLDTVLTAGTLSTPIAIEPADFLREVIVTYGTAATETRPPALEIRGRYAESWLGRIGENRQFAGGWILLGTVDVIASPHSGLRRERTRITGQDGPFKRLRFVARRGSVDLSSATVDAGGGREETVPVNTVLQPDIESAPFAFSAGPLPIASLSLSPRLHPQSRVDATVEVWAQY